MPRSGMSVSLWKHPPPPARRGGGQLPAAATSPSPSDSGRLLPLGRGGGLPRQQRRCSRRSPFRPVRPETAPARQKPLPLSYPRSRHRLRCRTWTFTTTSKDGKLDSQAPESSSGAFSRWGPQLQPLVWPCEDGRMAGRDAMSKLLGARPETTAVMCNGNMVAIGACLALAQAGLVPGRDVLVIGFDAVGPFCGGRCGPAHFFDLRR